MADLPALIWWFEIHTDRFLLWEVRQTRWQIYPPGHGDLRFIMIDSYCESSGRPGGRSSGRCNPRGHGDLRFIMIESYSESSGRQDGRSSGRSTPPKSKFRLILINSYSESSGRWGGRSTCHSPENGNLGFILIDCHFESSGRPGGRSSGRCNPLDMVIWDSYW